jgi:hypothetical protein
MVVRVRGRAGARRLTQARNADLIAEASRKPGHGERVQARDQEESVIELLAQDSDARDLTLP